MTQLQSSKLNNQSKTAESKIIKLPAEPPRALLVQTSVESLEQPISLNDLKSDSNDTIAIQFKEEKLSLAELDIITNKSA